MHVPPQLFLDLPYLCFQFLALCLTPELKAFSSNFLSTDVGKPKKIKGLRLSFSPFPASFSSKFAELNQTGFLWMQL
jgi:hypothetical protein